MRRLFVKLSFFKLLNIVYCSDINSFFLSNCTCNNLSTLERCNSLLLLLCGWLAMTQVGSLSERQERVWAALLHLVLSFSLFRAFHQSSSVFGIAIFEYGHCSCSFHFTWYFVPVFNSSVREKVPSHFQSGRLGPQIKRICCTPG